VRILDKLSPRRVVGLRVNEKKVIKFKVLILLRLSTRRPGRRCQALFRSVAESEFGLLASFLELEDDLLTVDAINRKLVAGLQMRSKADTVNESPVTSVTTATRPRLESPLVLRSSVNVELSGRDSKNCVSVRRVDSWLVVADVGYLKYALADERQTFVKRPGMPEEILLDSVQSDLVRGSEVDVRVTPAATPWSGPLVVPIILTKAGKGMMRHFLPFEFEVLTIGEMNQAAVVLLE
jgi:hypothetical protein